MLKRFKSVSMMLFLMGTSVGAAYAAEGPATLAVPSEGNGVLSIKQASRITIKGVVKDNLGETVIGASVLEKGTNNGVVTGLDGSFTLTVPVGAQIEVSYIGYTTQTIVVKSGVTLYNITLKEDSQTLSEVVVVGYGTQKKVNLTGSVASVSTDEIKDRVQTNVLSAVQGTVPGVTVISRPGSTPSINFRGRGNLGTSEPLYVIDGAIADATFFSNLDPNSIESISFLKDAASSAIYGSRAAYGVVLVTTKGGKKDKMNVSYSGYVSFDNPTNIPQYVNSAQYAELYNEAVWNGNTSLDKYNTYSQEEIGWLRDGSKPDLYPNTNWEDLVLDKNVVTTQHSLNFSGGSEKIRYFAGLGYLYKDNFKPGQDSHRYNMNLNVDSDITNWLTMKVGVKYIRNDSDREGGDPGIYNFGVVPSVYVARQSNGEWGSMAAGRHATGEYMSRNPLRVLSYGDWSHSKTENTMYDLGVDIKPVKGLVISGSGIFKGYEYKNKSFTATRPSINWFDTGEEATGTGNTDNYMSMSWSSTTTMLYTGTARYDWNNDNHEISALVGTSYEHYKYEALGATRQNFPNDQLTDLDSGSKDGDYYGNSAGVTENKMLSYFARINYVLKNRYLFEANMRADASSRFHKDHRWGYFPSFSAGWRISEESFMKGVKWVNNLKLRASYGMLGNINNVGNYDYFYLYASDGSIYNFDEAPVAGVYESKVANSKLGWEKVSLLDVGVDFEIFNGLLNVTADYYVKKTSDILLSYNVAAETGIGVAPSQNLGKVRNNGFEMAITHRNKIGDFSYSVSANISTNSNEITDMGESGEIILNGGANIQFIQRVGESIGSFYGLKSDGLYTQEEIDAGKYYKYGTTIPNAGDIKYVPQRDLEYGESISLDQDRTIIGCDVPSFTYGLNINLQYKNFEFSMFGQGVAGTKVGFGSYGLHPFYHGFDNPREYHLQRWTVDNPNPNAAYPRLYQNGNAHATYNQLFSDFYLFDADYFRFKTLSLGYSVPSNLVNRWGLQTLKVFLTGENLFTIRADKKLKDFDPESASGIISALGIKSFAIGVNVSF